jgi:hypothetical protein
MNKRKIKVFIDPTIFESMSNPDVLSIDVAVFKNGGTIGDTSTIPVIIEEL